VKADRQTARERRVEVTYGITEEQYQAILAVQHGGCGMCGRKTTGGERKGSRRLAVDHDHALARNHDHPEDQGCPECVRGLLCAKCNDYLGYIRDSLFAGARIHNYLAFPPAWIATVRDSMP
jgi:hypothetical protein